MKNKKKQIIITLVAIISLIVITVGVTYAFFNYAKEGTTDNTIKTGSITFLYTEVSGVGKGISLTEAYPVADSIGKVQVGEGKIFDFKVTSNIEMNSSIGYQVTARKKTGSTLANSAVKVYLTEVNGTEQELLLSKYSELSQTDKVDISKYDERILYEGTVPANTSNYEKNFRLRMWVDENTDFTDGSMNDKTFTLTVNVYADGKVITDNLDTTNTLDSITVSDCTLNPVFNSATTEYSCTVKNNISSVTVNAQATSTKAKVRGLGTKDLTVGKNTLPIRVIAEDGSEKIYNVNVTRKDEGKKLKSEIMKNTVIAANPTLTTSSNDTNDASGLYKSTDTNTGKPTYYFRGNVTNNYVSFASQIWRIVRVNEDGTIRIVMQDGINSNTGYEFNSNYGNYMYMYYTNSQAKTQLENWYQTNIGSKADLASNVATGNYYCEQARVKKQGIGVPGNAIMVDYTDYTPDFKCETDGNGKGIVNASIGLITYDEVVYAGGYYDKSNESYYLYKASTFWTMSPDGIAATEAVWAVYSYGIHDYLITGAFNLRPVLNLRPDIQISDGDGTINSPFVVKSSDDADNNTEYTKCADEGSVCTLPSGNYTVKYGANGQYKYLYNQTGSINCDSTTFGGDPINGTVKKCEYKLN